MNNISFINRVDLAASVTFDERSPQLGEKPSDHFPFMPSGYPGENLHEAGKELLSLMKDIIEGLPEELQNTLSEWMKGHMRGDTDPLINDVDIDSLMEAFQIVLDELIQRIDINKTSDLDQANTLDLRSILTLMEGSENIEGEIAEYSIKNLIKDYVEGHTKISKHYGNAKEYSPVEVLSLVGQEWRQLPATESALQSIAVVGGSLSEALTDYYRESGQTLVSRNEGNVAVAVRQDMVLDKNITHTIIIKALEALNGEIQKTREVEFSLKVYPRSLGEVQISVSTTRELINISIDSTDEVSKLIKDDIINFSKKYDSMKWSLNSDSLMSNDKGGEEGAIYEVEGSLEVLPGAISEDRIINIII